MALGSIEDIKSCIFNATSPKLDAMLRDIPSHERGEVVGWLQDLRDGLAEYYTDKFAYYRALPWKASEMDGGRLGNYTGAVSIAVEIAKECTEMQSNGSIDRAQLETVVLWEQHKHAVKALARGELKRSLEAPKFGMSVKQKALLPPVNRWGEQAHAVVKSIMDDSPNMGPALTCAS